MHILNFLKCYSIIFFSVRPELIYIWGVRVKIKNQRSENYGSRKRVGERIEERKRRFKRSNLSISPSLSALAQRNLNQTRLGFVIATHTAQAQLLYFL